MNHERIEICGHRVDVLNHSIAAERLTIQNGIITEIRADDVSPEAGFLIPGFVDAHIHIESSMLLPSQFAATAVLHGTVATVSDPHEIANVCGTAGIELMLRDAAQSPFKFHFGVPACVPATPFETSGATLDAHTVAKLLDDERLSYLSEMMNFPGVLNREYSVMAKINAALDRGKPVDGHAPGLRGAVAQRYVSAGITTDHECTTLEEALDKLAAGCKIAIREGSAARNFDALVPLIDDFPMEVMFCSDDKHPDELMLGHINRLAARAVAAGCDLMNVLRASSLNAIDHYNLPVGRLQVGDPADFVRVQDLKTFDVLETYLGGRCVAAHGKCLLPTPQPESINHFHCQPINDADLAVPASSNRMNVIGVIDGQLITEWLTDRPSVVDEFAVADPQRDLLKLVVVNRYHPAPPAVAFVRGFGISTGAFASSVAHDSHNIIAVGVSDEALTRAINAVIATQGGLSVVIGNQLQQLALPVAGLMSTEACDEVARRYAALDAAVKAMGCHLRAPYMTLSFLALLVIPHLKLSDRGLFDVNRFQPVELFISAGGTKH